MLPLHTQCERQATQHGRHTKSLLATGVLFAADSRRTGGTTAVPATAADGTARVVMFFNVGFLVRVLPLPSDAKDGEDGVE